MFFLSEDVLNVSIVQQSFYYGNAIQNRRFISFENFTMHVVRRKHVFRRFSGKFIEDVFSLQQLVNNANGHYHNKYLSRSASGIWRQYRPSFMLQNFYYELLVVNVIDNMDNN